MNAADTGMQREHQTGTGGAAVAEPEARLADERSQKVEARLGDPVLYVLAKTDLPATHQHVAGQKRPAMITAVHTGNLVNLTVFLDGRNDGVQEANAPGTIWARSISFDPDGGPGSWLPRETPAAGQIDKI